MRLKSLSCLWRCGLRKWGRLRLKLRRKKKKKANHSPWKYGFHEVGTASAMGNSLEQMTPYLNRTTLAPRRIFPRGLRIFGRWAPVLLGVHAASGMERY